MPKRPFEGISSTPAKTFFREGGDKKLSPRRTRRKILYAHDDKRKWKEEGNDDAAKEQKISGQSSEEYFHHNRKSGIGSDSDDEFQPCRADDTIGNPVATEDSAGVGNTISFLQRDSETSKTKSKNEATEKTARLHDIVKRESEAVLNRHKDILFHLFSTFSGKQLEILTDDSTDIKKMKKALLNLQKHHHNHKKHKTETKAFPSVSASGKKQKVVQKALLKFQNQIKKAHSNVLALTKERRSDYAAKRLDELEDAIMAKFLRSDLNRAISRPPITATATAGTSDMTKERGGIASIQKGELGTKKPASQIPNNGNFMPFSLLYNECSIVSICKWAGQQTKNDAKQSSLAPHKINVEETHLTPPGRVVNIPTARVWFRKCSICNLWGHYEIECCQMKADDVVRIGREAKIQLNIRDMVENWERNFCRRYMSSSSSDCNGKEGDGQQSCKKTPHHFCEFCGTSFFPETMILCSGCEKYWHLQCLDLQKPPTEEEWFCPECTEYDSDASSTIQTDHCEGYKIEQKIRPRQNLLGSSNDNKSGFGEVLDNDEEQLRESKGDDSDNISVEETKMDGLLIKAKRSSEDLPVARVDTGSIVIWFPQQEDGYNAFAAKNVFNDELRPIFGRLGIVLAMNPKIQNSLIQEISLSGEKNDSATNNDVYILPDTDVRWIATNKLHVVARSASTAKKDALIGGSLLML